MVLVEQLQIVFKMKKTLMLILLFLSPGVILILLNLYVSRNTETNKTQEIKTNKTQEIKTNKTEEKRGVSSPSTHNSAVADAFAALDAGAGSFLTPESARRLNDVSGRYANASLGHITQGTTSQYDKGINAIDLQLSGRSIQSYRNDAAQGNVAVVLVIFVMVFVMILLPAFILKRVGSSKEKKPKNLYEQAMEAATPLIVSGYRKIAEEKGIAPTSKTPDSKIIDIYRQVGTAFREASNKRGEQLSAGSYNTIVLKFLQIYEIGGDSLVEEHLKYEINKYLNEGLREDYRKEIELMQFNDTPTYNQVKKTENESDNENTVKKLMSIVINGMKELSKNYKELSEQGRLEALMFGSVVLFRSNVLDKIPNSEEIQMICVYAICNMVKEGSAYKSDKDLNIFIKKRFVLFNNEYDKLLARDNSLPTTIYSLFYKQPLCDEPLDSVDVDVMNMILFHLALVNFITHIDENV
jgi:hypothetical protein